jgi:hypothetical protein
MNRVNPMQLDFAMTEFLRAEEVRKRTSLSHINAIESTNMGMDWYKASQGQREGFL